jgi:hypothetical protein
MEVIEVPALIAALLFMVASIGAKILATWLIGRMKYQISHVASIKQETLRRLRIAQSQKDVAVQNKRLLTTKKVKIEKRLNRMNKDMGDIEQDDDACKQGSEISKVE